MMEYDDDDDDESCFCAKEQCHYGMRRAWKYFRTQFAWLGVPQAAVCIPYTQCSNGNLEVPPLAYCLKAKQGHAVRKKW
jgi:hypothetical protein